MRPQRVAVIGNLQREYSGFVLGVREGIIRNGHRFRGIDFRTTGFGQMEHLLKEFKPDYIFTHMILNESIGKTPQTLEILAKMRKKFGTRVIHTLQDARRTSRYPQDISVSVDMGLLNQTECLKDFENVWKVPCFYWPYATLYQKEMADPDPELSKYEFVYTGNMNPDLYKERTDFIIALRSKIKLHIFQTQEENDKRAVTAELSTSAKAILGVGLQYDIEGYIDVRPFQYGGAGAFLITHVYNGMDKVFDYGRHFITFEGYDVQNVIDLYNYYQEDLQKVKMIRKRVFEYVQKCHSWEIRVQDAIDTIEGRKDKPRVFLKDWR